MSRQEEITKRQQLRQQQFEAAKKAQQRQRVIIGSSIVVGLLVVGLIIWLSVAGSSAPVGGQVVPPNANGDRNGIVVNPGKAKADAPLVQEFQDYQCPYCAKYDSIFGPRLKELADKGIIRLEFRTMTFLDANLRNTSSTNAAVAAACSDTVGAYAAYHKAIYANQPSQEGTGYTDQQLRVEFASQAGITGDNLKTFQTCYDNKATLNFVKSTNDAAFKAGVTGTPTYFLNGKDISKQINQNDAFSLDRALGTLGK